MPLKICSCCGTSIANGLKEHAQSDCIYYLVAKVAQTKEILRDPFPASIYPQLNELERNIAKMAVIDGMTAEQISEALGSPKGTVDTYFTHVYKALGVRRPKWARLVFDHIREVLRGE